jgi:hypothetical protein
VWLLVGLLKTEIGLTLEDIRHLGSTRTDGEDLLHSLGGPDNIGRIPVTRGSSDSSETTV